MINREILGQSFDIRSYKEIITSLVLSEFYDESKQINLSSEVIVKAQNIGHFLDNRFFNILVIEHNLDIGTRVKLASETFKLMAQNNIDKALIAYVSPNNKDLWRISFVSITLEEVKGKVKRKFSNPRRYSYVLGQEAKTYTPYKYLIKDGPVTDLQELQSRFSLEVVNKDFYKAIESLYSQLVGGVVKKSNKLVDIEGLIKVDESKKTKQEIQEFTVRLIGRLVFCWFLREKKSKNDRPLIPSDVLSAKAANTKNYYAGVLKPLFFEILNKEVENRNERYRNLTFDTIPYLNGGLFSPQPDELNDVFDVPDSWMQDFTKLLDTYNFTVDENTSRDVDICVDPEMLGRIFENLLAEINPETGESARKGTGSYYTPREIVEYMVDESLFYAISKKTGIDDNKLNALISYGLEDDDSYPLSKEESLQIVDVLHGLTILDPACGSGAFPIGVLQKIVYILQQIDKEAEAWLNKQLSALPPELRRHIEKQYNIQNYDYIRKLGIIRESIFGVDIQPIATEISKLRCFLTLIVEEDVDDSAPNRGIQPLPNLDFKFVTANTLLSVPDVINSQTELFEDKDGIEDLRTIRNEFFSANSRERDSIKYKFVEAQKKMMMNMMSNNSYAELTHTLSSWDPFSHNATQWFDPEWMFGIKDGFDVVIANPPYVGYNAAAKQGQSLMKAISSHAISLNNYFGTNLHSIPNNPKKYAPKPNLFAFFISRGMSLLKSGGQFCYIIPQTLLVAEDMDVVRHDLSSKYHVSEIVTFDERVFGKRGSGSISVATSSMLVFCENTETNSDTVTKVNVVRDLSDIANRTDTYTYLQKILQTNLDNWAFLLWAEIEKEILSKIKLKSSDASHYYDHSKSIKILGSSFYFDKGYVYPKDKIISKTEASEPFFVAVKLDKKTYTPTQTGMVIEDSDVRFPHGSQGSVVLDQKFKIIWKYMNFDHYYFSDTRLIIDFNHVLITMNDEEQAYFLFGLLNSSITNFIMRKYLSLPNEKNILIGIKPIKRYLRIPNASPEQKRTIIESSKSLINTSDPEHIKVIDEIISTLYSLTPEEIDCIKGVVGE